MRRLFETFVEQKALGLPAAAHSALEQTIRKLPEIDSAGVAWSKKNYRGGYTSYGSLSDLHRQFTVFDRLKQKLDRAAGAYAKDLGLRFPRGKLELSALWVNVMPKNCYHAFHIHPNSVVSGTYYVSVPGGSGPLRIEDPRASLFMACPPRTIQCDLVPRNGEVILFESWLKHEVPPHSCDENRISISFNYDWIQ
ncbi:MAG: hypothetical protein EBX52_03380 [Proteobacteria bacterium]|nr:hypothetical protein [Pseudomonadota bacterium]